MSKGLVNDNDVCYNLNKIIRDEYQQKMGTLYDDLVCLLYGCGDKSQNKSEILKLCAAHGEDNVREMLTIIAEDTGMEWENNT